MKILVALLIIVATGYLASLAYSAYSETQIRKHFIATDNYFRRAIEQEQERAKREGNDT